jgi:hypothetical protein
VKQPQSSSPKKPPQSSSPKKQMVNLADLPPNLSQYILDYAASNSSSTKTVGAPLRQAKNNSSPRKTFDADRVLPDCFAGRQSLPPMKEEKGALRWFYPGLSSADHTSLIDFFNFLTTRIPAMFSQLANRGHAEIHEITKAIQNFKRTFEMIKRVHRHDLFVLEVCNESLELLKKSENVICIHSDLPGLGDQTLALLGRARVAFLVGEDEQSSASAILSGSRRICTTTYSQTGRKLAFWNSGNKKKQNHSRGKREWVDKKDNKSEFKGKYDKKGKFDKKSTFTGEN